jgi:hypothetical protein
MTLISGSWLIRGIRNGFFAPLLTITAVLTGTMFPQQDDNTPLPPPEVCQGSLLYRSPVAGAYETVPLIHTDASFDVRGLVAAATVTQEYENSTPTPIEAVYVFPLPHDAAVYDMEIRIGNRIVRSPQVTPAPDGKGHGRSPRRLAHYAHRPPTRKPLRVRHFGQRRS